MKAIRMMTMEIMEAMIIIIIMSHMEIANSEVNTKKMVRAL